ncbi:COG1470 family protein [Leptothoe spongobia]|uniref:Uncharacterized protein n=1 Tax=Leptothoe spongobia TAU-MAC 1115 TaxID=1967444 RepID=A0A947GKE1_9CYAN|nr:hypothetical protein [Leptothoe spongobia]MBT9316678.1 hypothetical protein [Leptothoe spongobia TAU-MAC 1115]
MVQQLLPTDTSGENINPLVVVRTSSGVDLVSPGATFQLGITIHNQGQNSAIIYTYIEERSSILRQWCPSMQERLALGPNQSGEVVFKIRVPADALPEILEYDLVVDASDYYPDYPPQRYEQQLQVLAAERTSVQTSDPVFYIDPQTSSQKPVSAQPNIGLPVQVWVENRSERVDRFRLSCAGLPTDWETTITYPQDNQGLGLIVAADSMGLNPGARGQILLLLKPPANALAGSYVPTLRLSSQNDPTLNLLDLVYLQVEPTYLLQPTLQTLRSEVRGQAGLFEVHLNNSGNTSRAVAVKVQGLNQAKHCLYTLEEEQTTVLPQATQRIALKGEPQKWWRRPLYGSGRTYNFRIQVEDPENHPLLANELRGSLTWAARPWWQLLLLVLAVLGVLGTLAWLIWWYILRPPATPQILDFAIEDARYAEATGDVARVGWQIEHPERVKTLRVTGYSADGKILSGPLTYDLTDKDIPPGLAANCNQQEEILTCSNVRTDARKPGEYTFELTLVSKNRRQKKPITEQSDVVVIDPKPLPIVAEFFAPDVFYQEAGAAALLDENEAVEDEIPAIDGAGIRLNWRISQIAELQAFKLIGRTADGKVMGEINYQLERRPEGLTLPDELASFCEFTGAEIVCEDVPTEVFQAGTYQFELQTIVQGQPSEAEPILTELITIEPQAPEILAFLINGEVAQPKLLIPIQPGVFAPTLTIDWDVDGGETTSVSLLPVPGNVPSQGTIAFPLKPESGSTTISLEAKNTVGKSITQSVVVETFDPTQPVTAEEVAAAAAAAAAEASAAAMQANEEAGAEESLLPEGVMPDALGQRGPVDTERLSPSELPPRFN